MQGNIELDRSIFPKNCKILGIFGKFFILFLIFCIEGDAPLVVEFFCNAVCGAGRARAATLDREPNAGQPVIRQERRKMKNEKLIAGTVACILSLGLASGGIPVSAAAVSEPATVAVGVAAERHLSLSAVRNRSVSAYGRSPVYVAGKRLSVASLRIGGVDYIPARAAAESLGASYSYNSSTRTAVMRLGGMTLTATDGNYTVYASDRPLFALSPTVIMSDGRMYIPAESFAKAVGLSLSRDGGLRLSGRVTPLAHADGFYREDEVLWLARIIHAESEGEPLLGKIAVGNVVLNRVRSRDYPSTIYGVIFDRKYGVQFSPVLDGRIYNTPSYNSILAAKICLEGFDVSEGALFFLRPETSTSSWIPRNRPYLFSVGKHDFYK